MQFTTSKKTNDFIEEVYHRVGAENKAIFGRAGLFLALSEKVPEHFHPESDGVTMRDETILGDELSILVRAALNHRIGKTLNEKEYSGYFKLYFEYGCHRLKQIWEDSGKDQVQFITDLLKLGSVDTINELTSNRMRYSSSVVEMPVKLKILQESEDWTINATGGNGLMVISGKPGRGKSQLALDLLVQLAKQGVRFLFFDIKGELEKNLANPQQTEKRDYFFEETRAKYIELITETIPINPLIRGKNSPENAQIATEIATLIKSFASQLGAIQESDIRSAYQELQYPDFSSLVQQLEEQGKKGVSKSILKKIDDFKLFANLSSAISIEKWLQQSQVINFKKLGNDNETKSLTVAVILNTIMRQLSNNLPVKNGVQPLQMVLFIDEAHLLLPKEGKSGLLASLARQGRSWGFPVWLASQDADAFFTTGNNATDFSELADCSLHFSPETLTESQQKKILGQLIPKSLNQGEAIIRLNGKTQIGNARQFWRDKGQVI